MSFYKHTVYCDICAALLFFLQHHCHPRCAVMLFTSDVTTSCCDISAVRLGHLPLLTVTSTDRSRNRSQSTFFFGLGHVVFIWICWLTTLIVSQLTVVIEEKKKTTEEDLCCIVLDKHHAVMLYSNRFMSLCCVMSHLGYYFIIIILFDYQVEFLLLRPCPHFSTLVLFFISTTENIISRKFELHCEGTSFQQKKLFFCIILGIDTRNVMIIKWNILIGPF